MVRNTLRSERSTILPVLLVPAGLRLAGITVTDRAIVLPPLLPESMANFAPLVSPRPGMVVPSWGLELAIGGRANA